MELDDAEDLARLHFPIGLRPILICSGVASAGRSLRNQTSQIGSSPSKTLDRAVGQQLPDRLADLFRRRGVGGLDRVFLGVAGRCVGEDATLKMAAANQRMVGRAEVILRGIVNLYKMESEGGRDVILNHEHAAVKTESPKNTMANLIERAFADLDRMTEQLPLPVLLDWLAALRLNVQDVANYLVFHPERYVRNRLHTGTSSPQACALLAEGATQPNPQSPRLPLRRQGVARGSSPRSRLHDRPQRHGFPGESATYRRATSRASGRGHPRISEPGGRQSRTW